MQMLAFSVWGKKALQLFSHGLFTNVSTTQDPLGTANFWWDFLELSFLGNKTEV